MPKRTLIPIVYTMGKVASSSTSTAIKEAGVYCLDIHSLDRNYLMKRASQFLSMGKLPESHISLSMANYNNIVGSEKKYLFITLVREPISRNISAYFQNLGDIEEIGAKAHFDKFLKEYPHNIPLTWLDREFRDILGIDVYSRGFDKEKRFAVIREENAVIFRTDCPDETKSEVLSELLGLEIRVGRANVGSSKNYSSIYEDVKGIAKFPEDFISRVYSSKYVNHFWSPDEIHAFAQKWLDPQQT